MSEWMLAEVLGDDATHAAPKGERTTYCDNTVDFPMGKGEPTCQECRTALGLEGGVEPEPVVNQAMWLRLQDSVRDRKERGLRVATYQRVAREEAPQDTRQRMTEAILYEMAEQDEARRQRIDADVNASPDFYRGTVAGEVHLIRAQTNTAGCGAGPVAEHVDNTEEITCAECAEWLYE